MSTDRPENAIPGTGTTPTAPPTPAGGPPVASPPPADLGSPNWSDGQSSGPGAKAKDASREVAGHARSEVEDATQHAADEAKNVTETAKSEVRDVVDEARDAVRQQADHQSEVAAGAIARFRDDLKAMSDGDAPRDATADYLQRAARSLDGVVDRLERDGIEGALSGVRGFAQRSPGGFLAASAGAGFALGRILRNGDHPQQVQEQSGSDSSSGPQQQGEIDLTGDGPSRVAPAPRRESFVGGEMRR
jgi:uncharacterized protein YjbJ (UPF0337 family)